MRNTDRFIWLFGFSYLKNLLMCSKFYLICRFCLFFISTLVSYFVKCFQCIKKYSPYFVTIIKWLVYSLSDRNKLVDAQTGLIRCLSLFYEQEQHFLSSIQWEKNSSQDSYYKKFREVLKFDASQRIIFMLQMHPCKSVQSNMLKASNFTKNKPHHWCFDKNLLKHFHCVKSVRIRSFSG